MAIQFWVLIINTKSHIPLVLIWASWPWSKEYWRSKGWAKWPLNLHTKSMLEHKKYFLSEVLSKNTAHELTAHQLYSFKLFFLWHSIAINPALLRKWSSLCSNWINQSNWLTGFVDFDASPVPLTVKCCPFQGCLCACVIMAELM